MKSIATVLKYEGLLLSAIALVGVFMAPDMLMRFWYILLVGPLCLFGGLLMDLGSLGAMLRRRTTRFGAGAVVFTVAVGAALVFANVIAKGHDKTWDGTLARVNTLSNPTVKILTSLQNPIRVTGFFATGETAELEKLLKRYLAAAPKEKFSYRFVDPDKNPEALQNYDIKKRGAIVIEDTASARNNIITEQTEEALTLSIMKVTQSKSGPVCFLTGHGEATIADQEQSGASVLKRLLENENHDVKEIVLAGRTVPEDCAALVVAGPDKPLAEPEAQAIKLWVEKGGRLLDMAEVSAASGLEDWLATLGVRFEDDVVVEPQVTLFFGSQIGVTPVVQNYPPHEITKDLNQPTIFQLARSLKIDNTGSAKAFPSPLLRTSEEAWGETDIKKLMDEQIVEKGPADIPGPLVLGAALELSGGETPEPPDAKGPEDAGKPPETQKPKGRVVVFGDSTFARNALIGQLYNTNLVLNSIAWLTGREESIAVRPNRYNPTSAMLTMEDRASVFFVSVVFVPMLISVFGIGVIISRRRRSDA